MNALANADIKKKKKYIEINWLCYRFCFATLDTLLINMRLNVN